MSWRSPWTRLALVVILGLGIAASFASYREYERSVRIQGEIDTLRREADRVARENETLSQKIEYFASPDFKEQEAKGKLGLRRQEERVLAIQGDTRLPLSDLSYENSGPDSTVTWSQPNYLKWWQRFFPSNTISY